MEITTAYGNSGFAVLRLGLGGGQIGEPAVDDHKAGSLLNRALDLGITLIDTARGYGVSEERIGRHLAGRRKEFILSTKVGYGISGFTDWTGDIIPAGVDAALRRMNTNYIDIVHLHSCEKEVLERGDVIEALDRCVRAGKVRVAAYSGENEAMEYAMTRPEFKGFQFSVNVFDQACVDTHLPLAARNGKGVIAKRPIANAPWRFSDRPAGHYCEEYWLRMRQMNLPDYGLPLSELAIRFAAYSPGVSTCIAGSADIGHIEENLRWVRSGPLPEEIVADIRNRFKSTQKNWAGQV